MALSCELGDAIKEAGDLALASLVKAWLAAARKSDGPAKLTLSLFVVSSFEGSNGLLAYR